MKHEPKLLSRDEFREGVFARDNFRCVFCQKTAAETPENKLDAHHLIERRLFDNGGYFLENGITVCEDHHRECEMTTISVEEGREAANITKIVVPDQFYPEQPITKWGDYILEDNKRTKGELFYDESVQKILAKGDVLKLYVPYTKYGRTMHLPWSPGIHDDDKALKGTIHFNNKRVIVTKKMDGENTNMYTDYIHARSLDSKGGEDRAWVKRFHSEICYNIPEGWRVCGENLWAKHSIQYEDLKSYFYGFSIWDERNICQSWDDTLLYFDVLGITPVEVIYDGIWDEDKIRHIEKSLMWETDEGYVVRLADAFSYGEFKNSVAKYVRKGHVQTTRHWRQGQRFIPNTLIK
jgi:hypothetical protein